MIRVETTTLIRRSSETVFAFVSDFENNPAWQSGMVEAKFTTERPLRVGSTYEQVSKFLGRKIVSTFEVTDFEPGRMVRATTTASSFPITFTRVVEPAEGGTLVSAVIEGDASGFFKVAEPILTRLVQSSVNRDYAKLKEILEAEAEV